MNIRNEKEFLQAVKKQMYSYFLKMQKELPKYLEEFIESEFYSQYSPAMYEREKRILLAITSSDIIDVGNGYRLEIYLDPNKVSYDPSIWYYPGSNDYSYIKGDDAITVFENMANGIHGFVGNPRPYQTEGNFWETFLTEIGHGGTYDMFKSFKKHMNSKMKLM